MTPLLLIDTLGVLVVIKLVTRNDIATARVPGMIVVHLQAGCAHIALYSYTVHLMHTLRTQLRMNSFHANNQS